MTPSSLSLSIKAWMKGEKKEDWWGLDDLEMKAETWNSGEG